MLHLCVIMNNKRYKDDIVKNQLQLKLSYDSGLAYSNGDYKKVKELTKEYEKHLYSKDFHYGVACYDLATAYGELAKHFDKYKRSSMTEKRLFLFREAIKYFTHNKKELNTFHIEMLYANYANALYNTSRILSACYYYRRILDINPHFYMAVGNYGSLLSELAYLAYISKEEYKYLNSFAYKMCNSAYEADDFQIDAMPGTRSFFKEVVDGYSRDLHFYRIIQNDIQFPVVPVDDDRYADWCLTNHLYINIESEINIKNYYFAADRTYIPSIKNIYKEMFNQLVEEFCYDRHNLYLLSFDNSNDYNSSIKNVFLGLYSIIDRIAFFINLFFDLKIEHKEASGNRVFNCNEYKKLMKGNKMLEALHYSYQEFDKDFGDNSKPYNKDLYYLRNAFEHRYVFIEKGSKKNIKIKTESGYIRLGSDVMYKHTFNLMLIIREMILCLKYAVIINNH